MKRVKIEKQKSCKVRNWIQQKCWLRGKRIIESDRDKQKRKRVKSVAEESGYGES